MIMDKSGTLLGTTRFGGIYDSGNLSGGTAFSLTPPRKAGGKWTEAILWSFGNGTDGNTLTAGLLMDPSGNLYGTTGGGGANGGAGTVFKLERPSKSGGSWTESILLSFNGSTDGTAPQAGLIMDAGGNLYGNTAINWTVFELTPPTTSGGPWTESILWVFGNGTDGAQPEAGLNGYQRQSLRHDLMRWALR
jgi:uncharacterized repeat protein (TIGR03803 family)